LTISPLAAGRTVGDRQNSTVWQSGHQGGRKEAPACAWTSRGGSSSSGTAAWSRSSRGRTRPSWLSAFAALDEDTL